MMDQAQAKLFIRGINNSGAKILLAFIVARTALDVKEIHDWTGISSRETIYGALDMLKSVGMIESQVLTHGRKVWLPSGDLLPGFSQMSENPTPKLQMSDKLLHPIYEEDKESIKLINDSLPHTFKEVSDFPTPEIPAESENKLPSVAQILNQTHLIFDGAVVFAKGLESVDVLHVLGWVAYAYQQREHLSAPAGYVRNRLKDGDQPPAWILRDWQSVLPCDYLDALGLIDPEAQEEQAEESSAEESNELEQEGEELKERIRLMMEKAEARKKAKAEL